MPGIVPSVRHPKVNKQEKEFVTWTGKTRLIDHWTEGQVLLPQNHYQEIKYECK